MEMDLIKRCLKVGTGIIAVLVSILSLVKQTLPDPPYPRALLVCTTDGLPDLEVVCSIDLSTGYHTGYLDFDDGSDPTAIETNIPPPMPLTFFGQVWNDLIIWPLNTVINYSRSAWNHIRRVVGISVDQTSKYDSDNNEGYPVQMAYHHRYKRGGEYNIKLFLEGDEDTDSTVKIVRLKKSSSLVKRSLGINNITLKFKDNIPTRSLEYRIMDILRSERIVVPTIATTQIRIHPTGAEDWKLTDDCKFTLSPSLQHVLGGDTKRVETDDERVLYEYSLYSMGWVFGRRYVRFDGVMKCDWELSGSRKMEVSLKISPDTISRYGVFGLEEDDEDNNEDILVYDGANSVSEWSLGHKHKDNGSSEEYKPKSEQGKSGPIEIRCHGVKLSLVDPPLVHQPEGWHSKVWLEVTPLN